MAGPSQPKLYAWVHDYKTLGKDKLLGTGEVDVSEPYLTITTTLEPDLHGFLRSGDMYNLDRRLLQRLYASFAKAKDSCA